MTSQQGNPGPIPESLVEFQFAIGRACWIERRLSAEPGATLQSISPELERVSLERHIQAGRAWARVQRAELQAIAAIARTAKQAEDPHAAMRSLASQPEWASFTQRVRPIYVGAVLASGIDQQGAGLRKFLYLLQMLAES